MAWETRGGRRYYYRPKRVGKRVIKEYYGCGCAAEIAEQADAEVRAQRQAAAEELRNVKALLAPLDEQMAALDRGCRILMEATLYAAGFHRYNYMWRRRHGRSITGPADPGNG
jgi:hypothetical protein